MKRFFLLVTVLLAMTIFLTGCNSGSGSKSDGIDILNKFVDRENVIDDELSNLMDDPSLDTATKIEKGKELSKKTEDLKKDVLDAKAESSKKIVDKHVETFNKACDHFANAMDTQIEVIVLFSKIWETGKEFEDINEKEYDEFYELQIQMSDEMDLYESTSRKLAN